MEVIRFQMNLHQAFQVLGIDYQTRMVISAMMMDEGEWSISALSTLLGFDRKTIRRARVGMARCGLLVEAASPMRLTEEGQRLAWKGYREAVAVALGRRSGFSEEIAAAAEAGAGRSLPGARSVKLRPPKLKLQGD